MTKSIPNPSIERTSRKKQRKAAHFRRCWARKEIMGTSIAWIPIAFSLLLSGYSGGVSGASSQYENGTYLCKGNIHSLAATGSTDLADEEIAMRVTGDEVHFSGNSMLLGDGIKICSIGSIEFAKKDEMYFDSAGCSMDGKALKRQYGTYNYITKKLNLSNTFDNGLVFYIEGAFHCAKTK